MNINGTAGGIEYASALITDSLGNDLSFASFVVGLSTDEGTAPTVWKAPDVQESVGTNMRVKMLIQGKQPGTYFLWVKVTDNPEIIPLVCTSYITIK